jgi:hypothetical protein
MGFQIFLNDKIIEVKMRRANNSQNHGKQYIILIASERLFSDAVKQKETYWILVY